MISRGSYYGTRNDHQSPHPRCEGGGTEGEGVVAARARLSDADVRWVRKMYRRFGATVVASVVGCSRQHVYDIVQRKRRVSVKEDS